MTEPKEIFLATMHASGGYANTNTGLQVAVSTDGVPFRNLRGSDESPMNLDSRVNKGDSENLVFLADGTLRYYISNGNFERKVIWCVDSADMGVIWTSPKVVTFKGFD